MGVFITPILRIILPAVGSIGYFIYNSLLYSAAVIKKGE